MLGLAEVALERSFAATATALERCRYRYLDSAGFRHLVRGDALMSWQLLLMLGQEVHELTQLAALARLPAQRRLKHLLCELVHTSDGEARDGWIRLEPLLKQWELAQRIAVTRETLNRLLRQLESEGFVSRRKGWLRISESAKQRHEDPDI